MKVSIIIPAVTDRGYLHEAITSCKRQRGIENTEYEIILVSQGNPHLKMYADKHGIRYVQNDFNKGLSANVNFGMVVASGKYWRLCPDDDKLPPGSIATQYAQLESTGADFCHGNALNFSRTDQAVYTPKLKELTLRDLVGKNHIHGGTTMYKRSAHVDVGGWDESLTTGEEFEFHLRLLSQDKKITYVDSVVFHYRQHHDQKSTKGGKHSKNWQNRVEVIKGFRDKYRRML